MNEEKSQYLSYGGLGRVPLMWGIPLFPFLIFSFLTVASAVAGFMVLGFLFGLILPTFFSLCLFAMRLICEDDDRAIERLTWKLKGAAIFVKNGRKLIAVGSDFISTAERKRNAYRFFKENTSR